MISRGFPNIFSTDLPDVSAWYQQMLGMVVEFDSDWFVHLRAPNAQGVELGIIRADHEIVPSGASVGRGATMLTFVVDDVDATHQLAVDRGETIVEPPTDLFYGQRRMVVRDPAGTFVDVSSEGQPSQEFIDSLS